MPRAKGLAAIIDPKLTSDGSQSFSPDIRGFSPVRLRTGRRRVQLA
jgi:hypothetical protein